MAKQAYRAHHRQAHKELDIFPTNDDFMMDLTFQIYICKTGVG